MKKIFLVLVICLGITSCKNEEPNKYDIYAEKYYEYHPDIFYKWEKNWYEINMNEFHYLDDSFIKSVSFNMKGLIQFNENDFRGKVYEYFCESKTINYVEDNVYEIISTYDSLKDNKWYSYIKTNNITSGKVEEVKEGRDDLAFSNISFKFDDLVFSPHMFEYYLSFQNESYCYDSFYISDDNKYLRYTKYEENSEFIKMQGLYEYYFDEKYNLIKMCKTTTDLSYIDDRISRICVLDVEVIDLVEISCDLEYDITTDKNRPDIFSEVYE